MSISHNSLPLSAISAEVQEQMRGIKSTITIIIHLLHSLCTINACSCRNYLNYFTEHLTAEEQMRLTILYYMQFFCISLRFMLIPPVIHLNQRAHSEVMDREQIIITILSSPLLRMGLLDAKV